MYFEIQYTIADLRPLIGIKEYNSNVIPRLESFNGKKMNEQEKLKFVRSIGKTTSRRKTSFLPLEGETFKCNAERSFRFPTFIVHDIKLNDQVKIRRHRCPQNEIIYRGFFRNTLGVINRFQWGFNFDLMNIKSLDPMDKSRIFNQLIDGLLDIPVGVPLKNEKSTDLTKSLSEIMETCTTFKKHQKNTFKEYLEKTETLLIFRLTSNDLEYINLPKKAQLLKKYNDFGINLYKQSFDKNNLEYTVYFIVTTKTLDNLIEDTVNILRICLLRFFAEKECLLKVLNNIRYLNIGIVKDFLNAPIHNQAQKEMLIALDLNNKNCNYIITPDDRYFIEKESSKILNQKVNPNSALGLLI